MVDLVAAVVILVLLLIAVCACLVLSGHLHLRSFIKKRNGYKEDALRFRQGRRYNDAALDIDDPDDYRRPSRRDQPQEHRVVIDVRHPKGSHEDGHSSSASHAHAQGAHHSDSSVTHQPASHRADVHPPSSTHSSDRVVHRYTTPPVEVHPWTSHTTYVQPPPQPHSSRGSSYSGSYSIPPPIHPQPTNFGHLVPVPTLPHFSGGHPLPYRTLSKIAADDPDDGP
jgi:hypothetical protein